MNAFSSIIISAAGFIADRITKTLAAGSVGSGYKTYFHGHLRLHTVTNRGFAMNVLEQRRKFVVGVSTAVFILLLSAYAVVLIKPGYARLRLGMSLVAAGAAGNMYDRLVKGEVTDFLNLSFLKRIYFNVADILILVGSLLTACV